MGTVAAVTAVEVVPEMLLRDLRLRVQAVWFFLMVFLVGAIAGGLGHLSFLHLVKGPLVGRALRVGAAAGAAIGMITWGLTYLAADVFFPFHPKAGYRQALFEVYRSAAIAGPVGGVAASLWVVRHLRRRTGMEEPLGPAGPGTGPVDETHQ